jgi:hypothetical protein
LSARAVLKSKAYEKSVAGRLASSGGGSDSDRVLSHYAAEAAELNVVKAEHNVNRLEFELGCARRGVFVGQGDNRTDVPYPLQRLHEVQLRRLSLDPRLAELSARLPQLERQIRVAEERRELAAAARTVKACRQGLVWHSQVGNGSHVGDNEELLQLIEPSEIFIDAVVPERCLRVIHPGDKVIIRRIGTNEETSGTVKAVLGRTMAWDEKLLVAAVPKVGPREVHVVVSFDDRPDKLDFRNSLVGQPVEVLFGGPIDYVRQLVAGVLP